VNYMQLFLDSVNGVLSLSEFNIFADYKEDKDSFFIHVSQSIGEKHKTARISSWDGDWVHRDTTMSDMNDFIESAKEEARKLLLP